jgi:iron complex outermembrane receptor protein
MPTFTRPLVLLLAVGGVVAGASPRTARAQRTGAPGPVSLDSLLSTAISTASKYAQRTATAPASVTILSADQIRRSGYRTMQEVLENVRGFYVSNDRNYTYLGTRGFSRPSDYNNRVLLLVDGHTLNEQVWGGAPMGSDLPLNLDAIERIEIVRGPGSTLYGTNAMFAVINIVTRTVATLDGVIAGGRVGSAGLREGTLAIGHSLSRSSAFTLSGLVSRVDGNDLYYPEYDAAETNGGWARGLDWERSVSGLGALTVGDVEVHTGYYSRSKGIPTGVYGSVFNDARTMSVDESFWGDVKWMREVGRRMRLSGRLYANRYRYRGVFPTEELPFYSDGGGSSNLGAEGIAVVDPTSRHRLTIGSEFRNVFHAEYYELNPGLPASRDDKPIHTGAVFSQDEFQASTSLTVVGGLRWDWNSRREGAVSPRLAVIFTPSASTTLKFLYGEAFRAPSAAEADISTTYYVRNPLLKPERIRTVELNLERRVSAPLLFSGSLYGYRLHQLISQVELEDERVMYENVDAADGVGGELELDYRSEGPLSASATYALQRATEGGSGRQLVNAPRHIGTVALTLSRHRRLQLTGVTRYESGRRTFTGSTTSSFVRTDASLLWTPAVLQGAELSVRVTNLFDADYAVPAGVEHRLRTIPADGRTWSVKLSRRF